MRVADLLQRLRWPLSVLVVAAAALGGLVLLREEPPPLVVATPGAAVATSRVYVSGAVVRPGVYPFSPGARIEDALREAGGPSAEADLDRLNLSVHLRDEMHVQVPYKPSLSPPLAVAGGQINLNTASIEVLETLPGVGPVTAKRIVEQRETVAPFKRIEELVELKIVGASTFEKIRGRITAP